MKMMKFDPSIEPRIKATRARIEILSIKCGLLYTKDASNTYSIHTDGFWIGNLSAKEAYMFLVGYKTAVEYGVITHE
jgi:hypothetical protein